MSLFPKRKFAKVEILHEWQHRLVTREGAQGVSTNRLVKITPWGGFAFWTIEAVEIYQDHSNGPWVETYQTHHGAIKTMEQMQACPFCRTGHLRGIEGAK